MTGRETREKISLRKFSRQKQHDNFRPPACAERDVDSAKCAVFCKPTCLQCLSGKMVACQQHRNE